MGMVALQHTAQYRRPGLYHPIGNIYYAAGAIIGLLQGLAIVFLKYTYVGRQLVRLNVFQAENKMAPHEPSLNVNRLCEAVSYSWQSTHAAAPPPPAPPVTPWGWGAGVNHQTWSVSGGVGGAIPGNAVAFAAALPDVMEQTVDIKPDTTPQVLKPRRPSVHSFPVEFEEDLESIDEEADLQPVVDGMRRPLLSTLSPSTYYKLSSVQMPAKMPPIPASPSGSYTSAVSAMTADTGFDIFRSPQAQGRARPDSS